jgi:dipeptidase E
MPRTLSDIQLSELFVVDSQLGYSEGGSNTVKLVLYSKQIVGISERVDIEMIRLVDKKNPSVGYIPSCSDFQRKYFGLTANYFARYGIRDIRYFDLNQEYDPKNIKDILPHDIVYLSGGNTFYFLYLLQKRNLLHVLREYASSGGVLVGVSAGSIIMAKSIITATFFDENSIGLEDLESLGLVDFDFYPHWNQDNGYIQLICNRSRRTGRDAYLCSDADGIVVNGDEIRPIGNLIRIVAGEPN